MYVWGDLREGWVLLTRLGCSSPAQGCADRGCGPLPLLLFPSPIHWALDWPQSRQVLSALTAFGVCRVMQGMCF